MDSVTVRNPMITTCEFSGKLSARQSAGRPAPYPPWAVAAHFRAARRFVPVGTRWNRTSVDEHPVGVERTIMAQREVFGGKPVLEFGTARDRRQFLKLAGVVGVGASFVAGGLLAAPTSAEAAEIKGDLQAAKTGGDIDILNYALTLEFLEYDFYAAGLAKGFLADREKELVTVIGDQERQHVAAVTQFVTALGGAPATKPKITFPADTFASKANFLKAASNFEELGVTAYHGQVPLIVSGDALSAAASIAGVESRHAAIIAQLAGGEPFPAPIEAHVDMATVLAAVKPLLG
jgi:hypothetical protein